MSLEALRVFYRWVTVGRVAESSTDNKDELKNRKLTQIQNICTNCEFFFKGLLEEAQVVTVTPALGWFQGLFAYPGGFI